jgi:hypothetical protein
MPIFGSLAPRSSAGAANADTLRLTREEYAARAADAARVRVTRLLDGTWVLDHLGAVRTVRLDDRLGWPDLTRSRGVAGARALGQGRYVALSGDPTASLVFSGLTATGISLVDANASVSRWERTSGGIAVSLEGHEPVRFAVATAAKSCVLHQRNGTVSSSVRQGVHSFAFGSTRVGPATLVCR